MPRVARPSVRRRRTRCDRGGVVVDGRPAPQSVPRAIGPFGDRRLVGGSNLADRLRPCLAAANRQGRLLSLYGRCSSVGSSDRVDRHSRTRSATTSSAPDSRFSRTGSFSWRLATSPTMWGSTTPASTTPSDQWSREPDMNAGRWYPTTTTLADGSVLVVSGDIDTTVGKNILPQVWTNGTWRDLSTAQLGLPLYPFMFLAPDGRVFYAGPQQLAIAQHEWHRRLDGRPASTGGLRSYGTAVMYEPGKVLIVGGNRPAAAISREDRFDCSPPAWQPAGTHASARRQLNSTVLPDGTVLVTGGSSGAGYNNASCARLRGRAVGSRATAKTPLPAREHDSLSEAIIRLRSAAGRSRALVRGR